MANIQTLRQRIRSVTNINQITRAMEMVAASKLRRAQEATLRSRTYAISAREALARLRLLTRATDHPLFTQKEKGKHLVILFSSDRGLAGSYNSNLFKALLEEALPDELIVIGQKGAQLAAKLADRVNVIGAYTNWPAHPSPEDIRPITSSAIKRFTSGQVYQVDLLFTDFESTIKQTVVRRQLLPVDPKLIFGETGKTARRPEALFEPSPQAVLNLIVPRLIEVQVYQASLEAVASEHSMRMMAMKNASDNAEELTGDLTLTYNGARQAAITQELAEITSGAEAINL